MSGVIFLSIIISHLHYNRIWFSGKDQCPVCRLGIADALTHANPAANDEKAKESIIAEINALITPRSDTVDELSRLYELNFYSKKTLQMKKEEELIRDSLPRDITIFEDNNKQHIANDANASDLGLYTVGAVEYGLPVPVPSVKCYNTSIVRKHASVLNSHLTSFYKTYVDHL